MLLRRAFSHLPRQPSAASTAAPSRSSSPVTARAPRGWPGCAPHDPVDVVGPLGRPFALPQGAGRLRRWSAAATARRRCSRSPSSCAPAAAGSTSCSARRPRTGCSARSRPSGSSQPGRRSPPTTARAGERGRVTDVLPGADRSAPAPTSSTPAGRWRCSQAVADDRAGATAPTARCAVEESMACGIGVCMTCVLPVRRRRRRDPDGALLRRGAGVPRRPGPLGRRRHRARPTPSAPRRPSRRAGGHR